MSEDSQTSKPIYDNIWDILEKTTDYQERSRINFFINLCHTFTTNLTTELARYQKEDSGDFTNRKMIFRFSVDIETEANQQSILFYWPTIYAQFKTRDFHSTRNTKYLVSNILRHMVKWINDNYTLSHPIYMETKATSIRHPVNKNVIKKTFTIISF